MEVIVSDNGQGRYQQEIVIGRHHLTGDEPPDAGGDDAGPAPMSLLLASLGTCTAITLRMYAEKKALALAHVRVTLNLRRDGEHRWIDRQIALDGALSEDERQRLLEIAGRCPMARALQQPWQIDTTLSPASP